MQDKHFKSTIVIELKKLINTLNTVNITNTPKPKPFEAKKYTASLDMQLKNDIKNRPYLYKPPSNSKGDLTLLIGLIRDLFTRKKTKEAPISPITYKEFHTLFSTNNFFTKDLLTNDLSIKKQNIPLFFDYCGNKRLNNGLLLKENKIVLLDSLFKFSKEFNKLIAENNNNSKRD